MKSEPAERAIQRDSDGIFRCAARSEPGSALISPKRIFDYLKQHGGKVEGEYVLIAGWPVQFLPPVTPLVEEALNEAVSRDVDGTSVQIFTSEHLAAIAL